MLATWTTDDQMALAYSVLAFGALVAGGWTAFSFVAGHRLRAAEWIHSLFREFYLSDEVRQLAVRLEYGFFDEVAPLLERRLFDREVTLSNDEIELLSSLDTVLNYLEFVLYLVSEHRVTTRDAEAVFDYWFGLVCNNEHAALRRYIAHFGFEHLASRAAVTDEDFIFFYGSLMAGQSGHQELIGIKTMMSRISQASVAGTLFDLGEYPGLVLGSRTLVLGEVYRIHPESAQELLHQLDAFERFNPATHSESLFVRRMVRLVEPGIDAWLYVYNRDTNGCPTVESGNWQTHCQR